MYVEFKNVTTGNFYYLCGIDGDYAGIIWTPDIINHLVKLDIRMTVGQLCDLVSPVVERLTIDNNDKWEMSVFQLNNNKINSLTESITSVIARYEIDENFFINGVRQKTQFHSTY